MTTPLQTALAAYRTRMRSSNRAYMAAQISAQDPARPARARLDALARHWGLSSWPDAGHAASITDPAHILASPPPQLGIDSDGTIPPASAQEQQAYLAALEELLNLSATAAAGHVAPPEEFAQLLRETDGLSDPDFAQRGECGLYGTVNLLSRYVAADMLPYQRAWYDMGLEVASGWQAALGERASTCFLFCRTEDEEGFTWRIAYTDRWVEMRIFGGLVEFMDWKAGWLGRVEGEASQ